MHFAILDVHCVVLLRVCFFFFKQKTAYEMRISDWSSDVCSSDLLVAGSVNQSGNRDVRPMIYPPRPLPRQNIRQAGTETAEREQLGDYYLYPISGRKTIDDRQTKQVSFLDVQAVPAQRTYEYRVGWLQTREEHKSLNTDIKFSSSSKGGLGDALPAGTVRFYMKDASGAPQFIGENSIGHTDRQSTR